MSTLLVLKFDSVGGAAQMRDRMLSLQKQQLITIEDAAIMWKDADGKPKLTQLNDMAGVGALGGAFWGMLFGLLFFIPVIGLALGAATGAIVGSMSDVGIDDKFIKQVGESITPGTSALFLLTSHAVLDKVLEQTKDLKYDILQSNLSQDDEDRLRAAISASANGPDGGHTSSDVNAAQTPQPMMANEGGMADTSAELTGQEGQALASEVAPEAMAQEEHAVSSAPAATATTETSAPTETPPDSSSGNA